ncbi:Holliday junction resolvase RuvX [Thermodesulfobacteriota bacterium]
MKYMGLDVGSKTIGIAISDDFGWTAQPITTIRRKKLDDDLHQIVELIDERDITEIVIGLPKNMNGSLGKSAEKVIEFADFLKSNLNIPISFWDERMSTQAVTRTLLEADVSRKKRKKVIDKLAAAYILQGFLDYLEFHRDNIQ